MFINVYGIVWGVFNCVIWSVLNDVFVNMGGSGMIFGLIIVIFFVLRCKDYCEIVKLVLVFGFFNINELLMFGLLIVLNLIMVILFVLILVINILVGYIVIVIFNWILMLVFGLIWIILGLLMLFLGIGGNWFGLIIGFVCLGIFVLMYMLFVFVVNKMMVVDS